MICVNLVLKLLMLYLRSQIQNKNRWRFALQNCKTLIASSKTVGNPLPYTIANYDASDVNITQTGPIPTVQINHGKFWVSCRTIALFCTTYSTFHSHTKIGTYLENVTQQWTRGGCWFLTKNRVCCKKSRLCIYTTLNTYLRAKYIDIGLKVQMSYIFYYLDNEKIKGIVSPVLELSSSSNVFKFKVI